MKPQEQTNNKERVTRKDGKDLMLTPKPLGKRFYRPTTDKEFRQLAHELLEWCQLPTSVNLNDFPISKMISPYRFKRYDHNYFTEALEMAKYIIASRNRALTNTEECKEKIYFQELYLLDKDYRESEKEKADAKKQQDGDGATKYVVLPEVPSSDRVPEKKR